MCYDSDSACVCLCATPVLGPCSLCDDCDCCTPDVYPKSPTPHDEVVAWQLLRNATDGAKWSSCADAYDDPCRKCAGYVGCDMKTGRIVSIDLDSIGLNGILPGGALAALGALQSISVTLGYFDTLRGTLPPELARLADLRSVSITGGSSISGTLPAAFGKLTKVGGLTLGSPDDSPWPLSGTLPIELSTLGASASSFLVVAFGPNRMSGTLPAYSAWSRLQRSLLLSGSSSDAGDPHWGSSISGTLPAELLGRLSALGDFELRSLRRISGSLPTQVGRMASLADGLALVEMRISGTFPTEFGQLTNLVEVEFGDLPLSGTVPQELVGLTKLTSWVYDGPVDEILCPQCPALSGTLPHAFTSMTSLQSLEVQDNHMSGTIPNDIGRLGSLGDLSFAGMRRLSGTIAPSMGNLSSLSGGFAGTGGLQLSDAPLVSGTLPSSLGNLDQLSVMGLSRMSRLSGTVPSELQRLTAMTDLSIDIAPSLSGSLPGRFFSRLISMQHLSVVATAISGTIPTEAGHMTSLDGLTIGWSESETNPRDKVPCRISGTLPTQMGLLTALRLQLEVSGPAAISGTLPVQLRNMTILDQIILNAPRLSGSLPGTALGSMPALTKLSAPGNRLSGTLPPELCTARSSLEGIYLAPSRISGTCVHRILEAYTPHPPLACPSRALNMRSEAPSIESRSRRLPKGWAQSTKLSSLSVGPWPTSDASEHGGSNATLTSQPLSGTIPKQWATLSMFTFEVANCNLHGNFSFSDFPGWSGVTVVDLERNNFSGPLLENCSTLQRGGVNGGLSTLKVNGNHFSGFFSDSCISHCPDLKDLLIQDQHGPGFGGFLPNRIGNLTRLQNLVAIGNALSGTLPASLSTLPNLQVVALAGNRLSGSLPAAIARVPHLTALLLGKNGLRGEIPESLASCSSLRSVDLSRNGFGGKLPPFASNHTLEELRLTLNHVSGTIPQSLLSLSQLRHLALDRNDLSCELADAAVGGGALLPAIPNTSRADLNVLAGNLIGCPVQLDVKSRDAWGTSYVCGLARLLGSGASVKITSPAGMLILSIVLFIICTAIKTCRSNVRTPVASSAAPEGVKREFERFMTFQRAACATCAVTSLTAVGLAAMYVQADSAMTCRYEKAVTAAFVSGGLSTPLMAFLWVCLVLAVVMWGATSQRLASTSANPSLVILQVRAPDAGEHEGDATARTNDLVQLSDSQRLFRLVCFRDADAAIAWASSLGIGSAFYRIDHAMPDSVDWRNAIKGAGDAPAGGTFGRYAAKGRGALLVLLNGLAGLACGAAPNVLYVLLESRVITFQSELLAQLAVMLIALSKTLIGSKLVPLLSVLAANWLLPMTLQASSAARSGFSTSVTFFNALCWPILAALTLNPSCFRDRLVIPAPVALRYNLTDCFIQCTAPGSADCPNAGHLYGCEVALQTTYTSTLQPEFEWNDQCASIAVSIYGPIYMCANRILPCPCT